MIDEEDEAHEAGEAENASQADKDMTGDELLETLRTWERASRQAHSQWKKDSRRWYDMVAGEQWASEDKATLMEQMRSPITFNRIDPMVSAVCGAEILNRQEVQYYPREVGDAAASEMFGAAADYVRDNCDAEDEESDAFQDVVICGMGFTETYLSYEEDPEGQILIGRIDPMEMGWDPHAKKRNITDAKFIYRMVEYDKESFKAKFGAKKLVEAQNQQQGEGEAGGDHWNAPFDQYRIGEGTQNKGELKKLGVIQMQWWKLEEGYAVGQGGQVQALDPQQYKALVTMALGQGMPPPPAAKQMRRVYYEAIYTGNVLIKKRKLECGAFTFHCITGKRDRNRGIWYGIVKAMMDPQMWANKWLSQLLHIVNSNAKGGLIYESDAFANPRKAEEDWAKPDGMIEVKHGVLARGGLQPRVAPPLPQGLQSLMEFSIESLPQVSGINLEMLGLVQREQAGVLEQQRKRSGYAILAVFFDALRRYRKIQGRVLLEYITKYISDGRLIRIKGKDGEQFVPLVRQPGATKFDIVVDESPMSQNQKEMVWSMLVQMMPLLKDAPIGPDVWAKMIEYSPLPSSLSAQISKALTTPPPPDPMQELEVQHKQAIVEKDKSAASLNYAKAQESGMPQEAGGVMGDGPVEMVKAQNDTLKTQAQVEKDRTAAIVNMATAQKIATETRLMPFDRAQKAAADRAKVNQMQQRRAAQPASAE